MDRYHQILRHIRPNGHLSLLLCNFLVTTASAGHGVVPCHVALVRIIGSHHPEVKTGASKVSTAIIAHPARGLWASPWPGFFARHEIKQARADPARVLCRVWAAPSARGPARPSTINCRPDRGTWAGPSTKDLLRPMSPINFVYMYI